MSRESFIRQICLQVLLPVVLVAVGFALRAFVFPFLGIPNVYLTLFPAVIFSALFGGMWAGLLATLLSAFAATYLLNPYGRLWIQSTAELLSLLFFLLSCGMFSLVTEAMRRAQKQSQEEARQLAKAVEEKLQAQQQQIQSLKEADRLKDQFLSVVSHELRTPLNSISGFGSILEDEIAGPLNQWQHEYLSKMLSGADKLNQLISDLLDLTQFLAGKFTVTPRGMSFLEVAEDVVEALRPLADRKRLTLRLEGAPDLPAVLGDEMRVAQVLSNLVGNAIKFTPEGGQVWVRARVEGDFLRVEVHDTGIGIAPEDMPKLFKRFSQLDMSTTREVGGMGLGLCLSKAIVEALGGRIGAESTLGKGSTFWFTLPLNNPSSE